MKTAEINKFRKTYTPYTKPCVYDGLKLAVLYDEKEWAKNFGARWDAKGHCWWLPYDILVTHPSGDEDVVYGELNKRKMIVGTYGEIKKSIAKEWIFSNGEQPTDIYHLKNGNMVITVQNWSQIDVLRFEHSSGKVEFCSPDDGRIFWNAYVQNGFNKLDLKNIPHLKSVI
jgi:hypothetical protein